MGQQHFLSNNLHGTQTWLKKKKFEVLHLFSVRAVVLIIQRRKEQWNARTEGCGVLLRCFLNQYPLEQPFGYGARENLDLTAFTYFFFKIISKRVKLFRLCVVSLIIKRTDYKPPQVYSFFVCLFVVNSSTRIFRSLQVFPEYDLFS